MTLQPEMHCWNVFSSKERKTNCKVVSHKGIEKSVNHNMSNMSTIQCYMNSVYLL